MYDILHLKNAPQTPRLKVQIAPQFYEIKCQICTLISQLPQRQFGFDLLHGSFSFVSYDEKKQPRCYITHAEEKLERMNVLCIRRRSLLYNYAIMVFFAF